MALSLRVQSGRYAVCRLSPTASVPSWAMSGEFFNVSRTTDELSVLCDETLVPEGVQHARGWACLKLQGPFEFTLTGILASVLNPLRDAGIGIFAVSTFDTDYVLVAAERLEDAVAALQGAGHQVA